MPDSPWNKNNTSYLQRAFVPKGSPGLDCLVTSDQPCDPGRNAEHVGPHLREHLERGLGIPILQVGILRHGEPSGLPKPPSKLVLGKVG